MEGGGTSGTVADVEGTLGGGTFGVVGLLLLLCGGGPLLAAAALSMEGRTLGDCGGLLLVRLLRVRGGGPVGGGTFEGEAVREVAAAEEGAAVS